MLTSSVNDMDAGARTVVGDVMFTMGTSTMTEAKGQIELPRLNVDLFNYCATLGSALVPTCPPFRGEFPPSQLNAHMCVLCKRLGRRIGSASKQSKAKATCMSCHSTKTVCLKETSKCGAPSSNELGLTCWEPISGQLHRRSLTFCLWFEVRRRMQSQVADRGHAACPKICERLLRNGVEQYDWKP
jgi:hypothetical protein